MMNLAVREHVFDRVAEIAVSRTRSYFVVFDHVGQESRGDQFLVDGLAGEVESVCLTEALEVSLSSEVRTS